MAAVVTESVLLRLRDCFAADPWYLQRKERLLTETGYLRAKRLLDVTLTVLMLPLVLVILLLCVVAIKVDSPGPAFFRQERTGQGGRRFRMFKLRTMTTNADALKPQYAALNDKRYPDFKIANDPRTTRVGRVLRRMSLDELPQVFNVLRGDMSLVGPRPTSFAPHTYQLWHTARLEVAPGMTGLWQISGRNELSFDERLRLDVAYIRNRTLLLDLEILRRTFAVVISGRGAN
jgi:lipopolysaccharide/colanic/teichoic acid biosynthesis glycosyltransferase